MDRESAELCEEVLLFTAAPVLGSVLPGYKAHPCRELEAVSGVMVVRTAIPEPVLLLIFCLLSVHCNGGHGHFHTESMGPCFTFPAQVAESHEALVLSADPGSVTASPAPSMRDQSYEHQQLTKNRDIKD